MAAPQRNFEDRPVDPAIRHPVDPGVADPRDPAYVDPATGVRPAGYDSPGRSDYGMPPARSSGWKAIMIGVVAFGLLLLVAMFTGLFQFGDDAVAPSAPIESTSDAVNPLDGDEVEVTGSGEEIEAEPGAADVPGTGTPIAPAN